MADCAGLENRCRCKPTGGSNGPEKADAPLPQRPLGRADVSRDVSARGHGDLSVTRSEAAKPDSRGTRPEDDEEDDEGQSMPHPPRLSKRPRRVGLPQRLETRHAATFGGGFFVEFVAGFSHLLLERDPTPLLHQQ